MVKKVKELTKDWSFDVISVGYPGPVVRNRPLAEPYKSRTRMGAIRFREGVWPSDQGSQRRADAGPWKLQAARCCFLGWAQARGSAMIAAGILEPMELGHLPYRRGKTFEDFVGAAGLKCHGKRKWKRRVNDVVKRLVAALEPENVALGGATADKVGKLPPNARLGANGNAFEGGFRLWRSRAINPEKTP
jgi:polyphosphate glucokinase